jgi:DNA repair exonuclease SbcCD nuclease subunit
MKVAITADVHLKKRAQTPERWHALNQILKQAKKKQIKALIIAGDLFDAQFRNYSQFDNLCSKKDYQQIKVHIIPGNHDPLIKQDNFTADNIIVYEQPELVSFQDKKIFFVPYSAEQTMGSVLAVNQEKLQGSWILIGHGNWEKSIQSQNPIEPGVYMPLTRKTLQDYQPALTVLGHIHKPMDNGGFNVFYPGSPCGLEITETGRRSYLIINLNNFEVKRKRLENEVIYFDEQVVVYPMEDEKKYWQEQTAKMKEHWDLDKKEAAKTFVRIKISGYTSDKRGLKKYFADQFKDFQGWKDEKIVVDQLGSADNYELLKISEQVSEKINQLELPDKTAEPAKQEILEQAIKTIYQVD